MSQNKTGEAEIWVNRHGTWEPESWSVEKLNDMYLDIGLTGKPHQVSRAGEEIRNGSDAVRLFLGVV